MSRRRLGRATMAIAALPLLAGACTRDREGGVLHDLAAEFDKATVRVETSVLDLGTPPARSRMGHGWSYGQTDSASGQSFVWSRGPESRLNFEVYWIRDLELELRARPLQRRRATPVAIDLLVNGREIGTIEPARGIGDYRLRVPAAALRVGDNELLLRYRGGWESDPSWPRRQGEPLAVAWFHLRIAGSRIGSGPPTATENGDLRVAWGSRLDYHLRLPGPSRLELAAVQATGSTTGRLELTVASASQAGPVTRTLETTSDPVQIELPGARPGIVRLSFVAIPTEPARRAEGGLVLRNPTVVAERAPSRPAAPGTSSARHERPHVVVYLVDTLRADRLGSYGHPGDLTPEIDRFADTATLFEYAVAQSSWTRPAIASIFTGLLPHVHGVERSTKPPAARSPDPGRDPRLGGLPHSWFRDQSERQPADRSRAGVRALRLARERASAVAARRCRQPGGLRMVGDR